MSPYLAEFIGTFILIFLGNGVNAGVLLKKSKSENSGWIVITLAWGLSVAFAIYAVGAISGAHINPAVTLGLALSGEFEITRTAGYMAAQVGGAWLASVFVWLHYLPHWKKTESSDLKLAVFSTAPAIRSRFANLLSEIFGTFVLLFGIMFLGVNQFTEGLNPLVVGSLITLIGFTLGGTTGFAINPARDLGPRIAHFILPIPGKRDSDWSYAWIPVIGPLIGGVLGVSTFKLLFEGLSGWAFWVSLPVTLLVIILAISEQKIQSNHD